MPYSYDPELVAVALTFPETDITDVPGAREMLRSGSCRSTSPIPRIAKRTVPGPPGDPDIEVCVMTPRS